MYTGMLWLISYGLIALSIFSTFFETCLFTPGIKKMFKTLVGTHITTRANKRFSLNQKILNYCLPCIFSCALMVVRFAGTDRGSNLFLRLHWLWHHRHNRRGGHQSKEIDSVCYRDQLSHYTFGLRHFFHDADTYRWVALHFFSTSFALNLNHFKVASKVKNWVMEKNIFE